MSKTKRMKIAKSIAAVFLTTALVAGAVGVAVADLRTDTVHFHVDELQFESAAKAHKTSEIVAIGQFIGVDSKTLQKTDKPGDEGYFPGDPSEVCSLLNFKIITPLKGNAAAGSIVQVAVYTGQAHKRTVLPGQRVDRVIDTRFEHFFDDTGLAEATAGDRRRLLFLNETLDESAYSAASWGLAPIVGDVVYFGKTSHHSITQHSEFRPTPATISITEVTKLTAEG